MKLKVAGVAPAVGIANASSRTPVVDVGMRQRGVSATRSWSRIESLVVALSLTAVAWPFWAGRFLPFLDLPQHLALSTIIAHYRDPASRFAMFYQIDGRITPVDRHEARARLD